jgi:hypothetical protein
MMRKINENQEKIPWLKQINLSCQCY